MAFSGKKDDRPGYMDGIPVKIGERYKPPRKLILPVGLHPRNAVDLLGEEYDFNRDEAIATSLSKMEEKRKAEQEARRAHQEAAKVELESSTDSDVTPHEEPAESVPSLTVKPEMLIPTPVQQVTPQVAPAKHKFNLADFESDTSSPFDNAELNCLNDLEELKRVLDPTFQPQSTYTTQSYTTQPYAVPSWTNSFEPKYAYNSYSQQKPAVYPTPYVNNYYPPNPPSNGIVQTRIHASVSGLGGMRASKSVPDLVQENEQESWTMAERRKLAQTPPPTHSNGLRGLENWTPWPELDSPSNPSSSQGPPTFPLRSSNASEEVQSKKNSLPNPFSELSSESRELCQNISEMGFPLDRVARACSKFGNDSKKIVEHLLQIQALEDRGFPASLVEKALIRYEHNERETTKHLELLMQFLDLGFTEERITEALVQSANNRDEALDFLVS